MQRALTCTKLRYYYTYTVGTHRRRSEFLGQQAWETLIGVIEVRVCRWKFMNWWVVQCLGHRISFDIAFYLQICYRTVLYNGACLFYAIQNYYGKINTFVQHRKKCLFNGHFFLCCIPMTVGRTLLVEPVSYQFYKWSPPYGHLHYCLKVVSVQDVVRDMSYMPVNLQLFLSKTVTLMTWMPVILSLPWWNFFVPTKWCEFHCALFPIFRVDTSSSVSIYKQHLTVIVYEHKHRMDLSVYEDPRYEIFHGMCGQLKPFPHRSRC